MKHVKAMFQWVSAFIVGFCMVNLLCFGYERPVGWFDTPNGPSRAGWNPGTWLVHGTEGYGITKIDQNGYMNPPGILQEDYILCMGSSHTQGKEVLPEKKYTALVNAHFCTEEGRLAAYNIAGDAHYLPSIVKHFPAAIAAFPGASIVTIEIANIDFSVEQWKDAMQQTDYDEQGSVAAQKENLNLAGKIKNSVKEMAPLLSLMKKKAETITAKKAEANAEVPQKTISAELAESRKEEAMRNALSLIRSEFDGEIIMVYHPAIRIGEDGNLSCSYQRSWVAFQKACEENDIQLIDMGAIYLENYEKTKTVPYGFANTVPGSGHLNTTGHRLIAEALIAHIQEVAEG